MWELLVLLLALNATLSQAVGAIAVAVVTGGVAYLVARRSSSGSISTSDAATLWAESQAMRRELREEVVARREEVVHLREDLAESRAEVAHLKGRLAAAEQEIGRLRTELEEARP